MNTYTSGYKLVAKRDIMKKDMITLCNRLNEHYSNATFEPEPITDGGIVFKFKDNTMWYKTMRISIKDYPWIPRNVLEEWVDNTDVLIAKESIMTTCLKAFDGAPSFTLEELKIWESCFDEIGLVRKSKYPTKKALGPVK